LPGSVAGAQKFGSLLLRQCSSKPVFRAFFKPLPNDQIRLSEIQLIKAAALAKRNAGDYAAAEALFRSAHARAPDDIDCVHMLGVICFRDGRAHEAMQFFLRAGMLSGWQVAPIRLNFGLAAAQAHAKSMVAKVSEYRQSLQNRATARANTNVLVSVVIPSYNHALFVVDCLESVYRQTWRSIELIVIDDGSTDNSAALIRESLNRSPFPHQFIVRENRGAHVTINEGVALARGEYINLLNSDDLFAPERIQKLVAKVAAIGADWGFSSVDVIDESGAIAAAPQGSLAYSLNANAATINKAPTIGFAMLGNNVAVSTGNLFIRKAFFNKTGGFADLRYMHDWEFVLRASLSAEPVYVSEKLYSYRLHAKNTITEAPTESGAESADMLRRHFQLLLTTDIAANRFAPTRANWGDYLFAFGLQAGLGALLPAEELAVHAKRAAAVA
jgi:glycosyltransferase involved in cell wall biosynthesis